MTALYREGFRRVEGISGPLLFVRGIAGPACGELVAVESGSERRTGRILQIDGDLSVIQVFEGPWGLPPGASPCGLSGTSSGFPPETD